MTDEQFGERIGAVIGGLFVLVLFIGIPITMMVNSTNNNRIKALERQNEELQRRADRDKRETREEERQLAKYKAYGECMKGAQGLSDFGANLHSARCQQNLK